MELSFDLPFRKDFSSAVRIARRMIGASYKVAENRVLFEVEEKDNYEGRSQPASAFRSASTITCRGWTGRNLNVLN